MSVTSVRAALLAALVSVLGMSPLERAQAQQEPFPSRTITVIYPYSGLGGFEAMFRALFAAAQERLGQQIVIEPRGGANGAIGMTAIARARPDGHTIGLTNVSPTAVLPFIQPVEYDSAKDYAPVILLGRGESFVLAGPALKVGSLAEAIALAKAQPGTVTWSVIGAAQKLNLAKVEAATGARFLQVPYKGNAETTSALVGGHLMLAVDSGDPKVLMRGGAIRVLATNNPTRNPRFPDLPAVSEYVPGFESRSWHGVLAPAGTPRDRVEKLHAALNAALQQPKIRELVVTSGLTPAGEDPAVFAAVINADLKANSELIRKYNITN